MLLIDKLSTIPVYEQIINGIEKNILLGIYPAGSMLPSLRELSVTLSINPNTIQKSYAELTRRGVICPSPGSGCYVSPDAIAVIRQKAMEKLETIRSLAAELQLAGVPREDILATVCEVYSKNHSQTLNRESQTNHKTENGGTQA
ncbi:MAG: GntR family transcriptional regulator [Ruminococcaceae bacterium]|nr:GntR family transcriptional regulator [Oscillospiraceae bacterium]